MSKKQKTARAIQRKKRKQSEKLGRQAQYMAFRDAGQNKKSKRFLLSGKKKLQVKDVSHPSGKCGNLACYACNPADHNKSPVQVRLDQIYKNYGNGSLNAESLRGSVSDKRDSAERVFSPKRQLTKPWGAPLTSAEHGPMDVGE